MVAKEIVSTDRAPGGIAGYSQAVKAGGMIYVSGVAGIDPTTGELVGPSIQEQTAQSLRNIRAILEEAGSSLDKIVWAIWSLSDPDDFAGFNEEWARWFPKDAPARHGAKLPLPDEYAAMLISIGAIAEA